MPKRLKHNRGLPDRWQLHHGAFFYRVPPGLEHLWDGKQKFRLGATAAEAHRVFTERSTVDPSGTVRTAGQLLDRYELEVVPAKGSPLTRSENYRYIKRLRKIFGAVALTHPTWPMLFYQYADKRTKKLKDGTEAKALTAAHRELEVMSHAFTKAVQWGYLSKHPTYEQVRFDGDLALKPRTRYVEDWEVVECLSLDSRQRKGSVLMIQAYLRLKLLTGLSKSDMLRLRLDQHLRDDGIHVQRHKTKDTTGARAIYEYSQVPERRDAVEQAKRVRPALSPFLFCNRRGEGYIDEETGTCHGFDSVWSRFVDRVLSETKVKERFTEHDIRAKAGSDAESLERCRQLLMHADQATSKRIYRRKPERV